MKTPVTYVEVTEAAGTRVTREALDMLLTRYAYAASFSSGRDVLEVACGAAQGLGLLSKRARRVIGGDRTESLLRIGQRQYAGRVPLTRLDAHALPFADRRFDVVLLYEAIYYLSCPVAFLNEARRVLRPDGVLIICTANPERLDFHPSPLSTRYFTARELRDLLRSHGFGADVFGAFPAGEASLSGRLVHTIKRVAAALHLMPRSMKGKEWLKRLFFGPLVQFPAEVQEGSGAYNAPVPLDLNNPTGGYKVLYAVGRPG